MSTAEKIFIVGMGDDGLEGLTSHAKQVIAGAQILVGAESLLARVAAPGAEKIALGANLEPVVRKLAQATDQRIAILASGDPLFYGTARYLCDRLDKSRIEVLPHVSSMQLAFARVKESWDDAFLTDLANHALHTVVERIRTAGKVGLFTTERCTPAVVARALLDRKINYYSGYVCENLGAPDERVTQGELAEIALSEFAPLNVMILVRKPGAPDRPVEAVGARLFGNPDEAFLQSRPKQGLLTPAEVRSMALAEMDIGPSSTIWDVGAGSGSVAVEAARIADAGTCYAIEMDPDDYQLIQQNAERFRVGNLVPVLGRAPEVWQDLPDPDAIFVGGTGREVSRLVDLAFDRLKPGGRLVANVGAIESLAEVHAVLHAKVGQVNVWMINVARGNYQLERVRFEPLAPSFLLGVVKPK